MTWPTIPVSLPGAVEVKLERNSKSVKPTSQIPTQPTGLQVPPARKISERSNDAAATSSPSSLEMIPLLHLRAGNRCRSNTGFVTQGCRGVLETTKQPGLKFSKPLETDRRATDDPTPKNPPSELASEAVKASPPAGVSPKPPRALRGCPIATAVNTSSHDESEARRQQKARGGKARRKTNAKREG